MTQTRAVTNEMKREICDRLYELWTWNPDLRLGQLIGNVYRSTDRGGVLQYHEEDYPFIGMLEKAYARYGTDGENP